jgi:hypothetical protein
MKTGQLVGMFLKNRIFSLQTSMASIINLKKGIFKLKSRENTTNVKLRKQKKIK